MSAELDPALTANPFGGLVAWSQPPTVVIDQGAAHRLAALCLQMGARTAAVICDEGVAGREAVVQVLDGLGASIQVRRARDARPQPARPEVAQAATWLRRMAPDVVIAIGGGSTMDLVKLAAASAHTPPGSLDASLDGRSGVIYPRLPGSPLPLILVPTTAATGSEVNCNASILAAADSPLKKLVVHPALFARIAVVDPCLAVTVPAGQTAEGALETLCRLSAAYAHPVSAMASVLDPWIEHLAGLVPEAASAAMREPADLEARGRLAFAATMSGSLTHAGRDPHGDTLWYLQNAVSSRPGVTKGAALAALLPHFVHRYARDEGGVTGGRMHRFWGVVLRRDPGAGEDVAAALQEWLRSWGFAPGLAALGVRPEEAGALASLALDSWPQATHLDAEGRAGIEELYRSAL